MEDLYVTEQPSWVQIAEYAKTPALVRKRMAGTPCAECTKLNVFPTGSSATLIICAPLPFVEDFTEAELFGKALPAKVAATARAPTIAVRKTLRR